MPNYWQKGVKKIANNNIEIIYATDTSKCRLKKIAAYARTSSAKETMEHSMENQKEYYSRALELNPGIFVGIYEDFGESGTHEDRRGFQKLLADCRQGKIDVVITKSVTRFARNTEMFLRSVRELKALDIDVYFEKENLHSISMQGEIVITMLAAYAEAESRSVSENQKWRIEKLFKEGKLYSCTIFGYRQILNQLIIEPEEAQIVQQIFNDYLSGKGLTAIRNSLNEACIPTRRKNPLWNTATIRKMLRNEKYTGNMILQKTIRKKIAGNPCINQGECDKYEVLNSHEPIIDLATFNKVQDEIKRREQKYARHNTKKNCNAANSDNILQGLVYCGQCGRPYKRMSNGSKGKRWYCSGYSALGKESCSYHQIPDKILLEKTKSILAIDNEDDLKNLVRELIQRITITGNRLIRFSMADGREIYVEWEYPSRSKSWTPEMKEAARQRRLEQLRRKEKNASTN